MRLQIHGILWTNPEVAPPVLVIVALSMPGKPCLLCPSIETVFSAPRHTMVWQDLPDTGASGYATKSVCIQNSIRKWEWKGIRYRCRIQLPIVDADSYLTVLLRDHHYRT